MIERVPGSAISEEFVRTELLARLARYKVPKRIEFGTELPREDSGKIFKRKLRDVHWADVDSSI